MDPRLIKYGIMAAAAGISGFFLIGFIIFTISVLLSKKKDKTRLWGALVGVGVNLLIFLLTFPTVLPIILDAVHKVLFKFR